MVMLTGLIKSVADWHRVAGITYQKSPKVTFLAESNLLRELLCEEVGEYMTSVHTGEIIGIADALADIIVVAVGNAGRYGIDVECLLQEVMRSNWTKFKQVDKKPEDIPARLEELQKKMKDIASIHYTEIEKDQCFEVVRRKDGKILKHPETYQPPYVGQSMKGIGIPMSEVVEKHFQKFCRSNDIEYNNILIDECMKIMGVK